MTRPAEITSALLGRERSASPPLTDLWVYRGVVVARSERLGFCTSLRNPPAGLEPGSRHDTFEPFLGRPVDVVARELLSSTHALDRSLGIACADSARALPPGLVEGKATDVLAPMLTDRRVCFVGHFPRADVWREQGLRVEIVEMDPRPGDVHWDRADGVLGAAEAVFLTGQTLINGTLDEVVARSPRARWRVLMGPSVVLCGGLLARGIDLIGGSRVRDEERALRFWQHGGYGTRRIPPQVVQPVCLLREPGRLRGAC